MKNTRSETNWIVDGAVAAALVGLLVATRFLPHDPNFVAGGACALFAGFFFKNRAFAIAVPVVGMLISDAAIGFYNWTEMAAVYLSLVCSVAIGRLLMNKLRVWSWLTATLAGACLFFVTTNFFVFLSGTRYEHTWAGLWQCYVKAVPFFRTGTLRADLFYSALIFSSYALARLLVARRQTRTSAA